MTSPTPTQNSSTLVTFFGVATGSQVATLVLYLIQAYSGQPLPDPVTNAITGLTAGLVAWGIHKFNNAN